MIVSFDVYQARPETRRMARQASPFLPCFWSRLINLISKDTNVVFSINSTSSKPRAHLLANSWQQVVLNKLNNEVKDKQAANDQLQLE